MMILRVWKKFWRFCCPRKIYRAESLFSPIILNERIREYSGRTTSDPIDSGEFALHIRLSSNPMIAAMTAMMPIAPPTVSGILRGGDVGTTISFDIRTDPFIRLWLGGVLLWTIFATVFVFLITLLHGQMTETMPIPWGDKTLEVPFVVFFPAIGVFMSAVGIAISRTSWRLYSGRVRNSFTDLIDASNVIELSDVT